MPGAPDPLPMSWRTCAYLGLVGARNIAMAAALYDRPNLDDTVTFQYVFDLIPLDLIASLMLAIGTLLLFGLISQRPALVRGFVVASVMVSSLFAAGTIAAQLTDGPRASVIAAVAFTAFSLGDSIIASQIYHRQIRLPELEDGPVTD